MELIDSCGAVEAVRLLRLAIKRGAGGFGEHLQGIDRQGRWQAHGLESELVWELREHGKWEAGLEEDRSYEVGEVRKGNPRP